MENFANSLRDALPSQTDASASQPPEVHENDDDAAQLLYQVDGQPSHVVEPAPPPDANASNVAQITPNGSAISGIVWQTRVQDLTARSVRVIKERDATLQALRTVEKEKLEEEVRANIAEAMYTAQEVLVSQLMDEKADLQNLIVGARNAEDDAKIALQAANAELAQYRDEAADFLQSTRKQAELDQQVFQRMQMELQESEKDKLHTQQLAEGLNTGLQESQQALQQHLDYASGEIASIKEQYAQKEALTRKKHADKFEEVTAWEKSLRAQMKEQEVELNQMREQQHQSDVELEQMKEQQLKHEVEHRATPPTRPSFPAQETEYREAQGLRHEVSMASALSSHEPPMRNLQDVRVTVYFSAESEHTRFSEIYKLTGNNCVRLQGVFNGVLAQSRNKLRSTFGSEWEVAPSQTLVICNEPNGSKNLKASIATLRCFDQNLKTAQSRPEADIESDIALVDWEKMSATFSPEIVAQILKYRLKKPLPLECYTRSTTQMFAGWVRRNLAEGTSKRLTIDMTTRMRRNAVQ